jgi:hypothetical protein
MRTIELKMGSRTWGMENLSTYSKNPMAFNPLSKSGDTIIDESITTNAE